MEKEETDALKAELADRLAADLDITGRDVIVLILVQLDRREVLECELGPDKRAGLVGRGDVGPGRPIRLSFRT